MFYIFEMANNHQGSVEHAKLIVDRFAAVAKETNGNKCKCCCKTTI